MVVYQPFALLARHRVAGVGLAFLVEAALLVALAYADPATVVAFPAAVAAAIGGTVAIVFGPVDGALVALAGAVVFVLAGGVETGELAALVVWPAIVAAAGLFGRRVGEQRAALRRVVAAQELERQRLALELHDETAQSLAVALLLLRRAETATEEAEAASAQADVRALLGDTIESVRRLAVDLRPKVLDDYGLAPAVERLAAVFSEQTGIDVFVESDARAPRLPPEVELVLFRAAQEALANVARHEGARNVTLLLERTRRAAAVVVDDEEGGFDAEATQGIGLVSLRARLELLGGRLTIGPGARAGTVLRAEVPL